MEEASREERCQNENQHKPEVFLKSVVRETRKSADSCKFTEKSACHRDITSFDVTKVKTKNTNANNEEIIESGTKRDSIHILGSNLVRIMDETIDVDETSKIRQSLEDTDLVEGISASTRAFAVDSETMGHSEENEDDQAVANMSDFWDKETYLSEYNYDEPIDVDTAKKLLNFGDDYRNFIDSHSESLVSPRQPTVAPRRRKSQKDVTRKTKDGSNSETEEFSQLFEEISDCKNIIKDLEEEFQERSECGFSLQDDGCNQKFEKEVEKLNVQSEALKRLVTKHSNSNTFVGRKLSREVRFLQSGAGDLQKKYELFFDQEMIYKELHKECRRLDKTLELQRKEIEENRKYESSGDLRKYLNLLKKSLDDLSGFKKQLFELNLGVHSLLGDMSSCVDNRGEERQVVGQMEELRGEVVRLYAAWDMYNMALSQGLKVAEENMKKVEKIKKNIGEFKESLRAEEAKLFSDDSGFSDIGTNRLQKINRSELSSKKKHLEKMSLYLGNLFRALPSNSQVASDLGQALNDASSQLESLTETFDRKEFQQSRSLFCSCRLNRLQKYCFFLTAFLSLFMLLCFLLRPECCEHKNYYTLYPRFSYVNGPPPI